MFYHCPPKYDLKQVIWESLMTKTSHAVKEGLVWGLSCGLSWLPAAADAQPGGGTVNRLLLGCFLWHESTRLKRHGTGPVPPRQPYALPPPMMREQLFWWQFGLLWGFDFFGKETESRRVTRFDRAAMFARQFLARCLKQTELFKFEPINVFCRWPSMTVLKLYGIVFHESL